MPSPIRKIVSSSARTTLASAIVAAVGLLVVSGMIFYQSRVSQFTTINYSQLYQIAEAGSAVSLSIESDTLTVQTKQSGALQATVTSDAIR